MDAIEHIVRHPLQRRYDTPILLQHGAWHGAWCWDNWLTYFAELGYETHAISLPGHGNSSQNKPSLNRYTLGDYVEVLAAEIDTLPATPLVIGHSMGGAVLQSYLQQHPLPGAVLLASIPPQGVLLMILRMLRQHPLPTLKALFTWNLYHCVDTPELAKSWFFSDDVPIDVSAFQRQLCGESFAIALGTLFPFVRMSPSEVPMLVIAAEYDRFFPVAAQRTMAQKYHADFTLVQNQAHNLMVESDWQSVADRIDRWAREKGMS